MSGPHCDQESWSCRGWQWLQPAERDKQRRLTDFSKRLPRMRFWFASSRRVAPEPPQGKAPTSTSAYSGQQMPLRQPRSKCNNKAEANEVLGEKKQRGYVHTEFNQTQQPTYILLHFSSHSFPQLPPLQLPPLAAASATASRARAAKRYAAGGDRAVNSSSKVAVSSP